MKDEISELVRQWKEKALSDWTAVEILSNNKNCPPEVVCFHCQQFVEKLLKALLTCHNIEAPKTHDLRRLILLVKRSLRNLFHCRNHQINLPFTESKRDILVTRIPYLGQRWMR